MFPAQMGTGLVQEQRNPPAQASRELISFLHPLDADDLDLQRDARAQRGMWIDGRQHEVVLLPARTVQIEGVPCWPPEKPPHPQRVAGEPNGDSMRQPPGITPSRSGWQLPDLPFIVPMPRRLRLPALLVCVFRPSRIADHLVGEPGKLLHTVAHVPSPDVFSMVFGLTEGQMSYFIRRYTPLAS